MQQRGKLYILCGLPYAGKTTLQLEIVKRVNVSVVSVDRIMDELGMWREGHPTQEDWNTAYSEAYRQITRVSERRSNGHLRLRQSSLPRARKRRSLADDLGVPHELIYVNTPKQEILRRRQRNEHTKERGHLDEKDMELAFQLFDEPTENERPIVYTHLMAVDLWIERTFHIPSQLSPDDPAQL